MAADRDHFWRTFTDLLGRSELRDNPRFRTNADQGANQPALEAEIETVLTAATTAKWMDRRVAAGIPCGPVYRYDQVFDDPHSQARGVLASVRHSTVGEVPAVNSPLRLTDTPVQLDRSAPLLGEHTGHILSELGYSSDEIERLKESEAVGEA